MKKIKKLIIAYALLIFLQLLHALEEILGKAYFIDTIYNGTINFLIISLFLLLIPIVLLYFINKQNKIAYILSYIYAVIMIIDGFDHIIRTYAGQYTGFGLIIIGGLLIFALKNSKY